MKNPASRTTSPRKFARRASLTLALASALAASGVHAQEGAAIGVAVSDGTNQLYNKAMMVFQKGDQYANAMAQLKQLTSTIDSIASNPLAPLIPAGTMNRLTQTKIQSLIDAKCAPTGSSSGNVITDTVFNAIHSIDPTDSIGQNQQRLCADIIIVQADQYNATVDLYTAMPELHGTVNGLQSLMTQLEGVMGNSTVAVANGTAISTKQQQTITEWKARTDMDTQIIGTLHQQQSSLASQALNAKPELLGSAVQAAALAAAFKLN